MRRKWQPFTGPLQLYSDEPLVTLTTGLRTLCSLHATILNLLRKARLSQIVGRVSVITHLPVEFLRALPESKKAVNCSFGYEYCFSR